MQDIFIIRSKAPKERTGEWDLFKPLHTVKQVIVRTVTKEMGFKDKTPLSKLL